jgi:septal ring factor EnvC (AmiA/AmiB activator)
MTDDVKIPPDPGSADTRPGHELRALGRAGTQAVQLIRHATASGEEGTVSAIEAVCLLDDAMGQLRAMQTAIPALLAAARPGPAVAADVEARAAELAALADQVSATRRELDLLQAREQETLTRLADLNALREQVGELRRRERLADALGELNEQRQVIEQRLTLLRQLTEHPETTIGVSADEIIRLAGERRELLAPHVRDALAQTEETLRALAEEETRARTEQERLTTAQEHLAMARQRTAQLTAEHEGRLAQLATHTRADSALAAALSPGGNAGAEDPVGQLRDLLDGITTQLGDVDGALRDALASAQAAHDGEHAVLGWTDSWPAGG